MLRRRREYRRLQRRLRELDRIDARHGLGTTPRPRRRRSQRQGLAVAMTVLLVMALFLVPGLLPDRLRSLVGWEDQRLLPPVATPTSGAHGFIHSVAGDPVRWDPCRVVRYVVNPAGAAPHWVAAVHDAVARVQTLSGLRFEYVGETDRRPGWERDFVPVRVSAGAPALVAWATADEVPRLADAAGLGGAARLRDEYGGRFLSGGGITLDIDDFTAMEATRPGADQQRAVILHELGHLVGLAHVNDPDELMHGGAGGVLAFGPGDRSGLAAAGRGPCR